MRASLNSLIKVTSSELYNLWPTSIGGRIPIQLLDISQNGKNFIRSFEKNPPGSGQPYLHIYDDAAEAETIGFGHKVKDGEYFSNGIKKNEAAEPIDQYVSENADYTRAYVNVPLYQRELIQLLALVFNFGSGNPL